MDFTMEKIRISKYFTDCGVMSRRAAEAEIEAGKVTVNGALATLGQKIDPEVDEVAWNGKKIVPSTSKHVYVMLNKPRGIVCSLSDEKGRAGVTQLCRDVKDEGGKQVRLYPVGRLDMDSDGLLLLTNDGELTNKLTHPRHSVPKIYHVTLAGKWTPDALALLGEPIELDGRLIMKVKVTPVCDDGGNTVARFELYEGRNRQIRRMCEHHGARIVRLQRVAIGKLELGELEIGKWRFLSADEVNYLKGLN
jgi:23S rRNA pseudouridine2605 synthase